MVTTTCCHKKAVGLPDNDHTDLNNEVYQPAFKVDKNSYTFARADGNFLQTPGVLQ